MTSGKNAVLYIHGKGGNADEAEHYRSVFPHCNIIGLDYKSFVPWETGKEIYEAVTRLKEEYDKIILIANSIGAYFSMNSDIGEMIDHAFFISPIVDMQKLITDMMVWAGVTEKELQEKKIIHTDFGEDLLWEYLCYVRNNPINWTVHTDILYGSEDNLTSSETIRSFAEAHNSGLTIMYGAEHWFHTDEQMEFLDTWLKSKML